MGDDWGPPGPWLMGPACGAAASGHAGCHGDYFVEQNNEASEVQWKDMDGVITDKHLIKKD